ncbi:uncharacterized protein LOC105286564 isoform X2 [Ooceraea biroi]|uniref:uncharacterized protein LOC105286564 isoform X2 n=1 Tax=Ooceraea biroi TaxID=2015173 RepID=UPI0005B98531|nr:uncharacterized protein LOC105286564 isoform X2 [Ooceraea biroi]
MSFTNQLNVYSEVVPEEMTAKTNLTNKETGQCAIASKPERVCDTLVASEEIVVGANGSLSGKVDCQRETTMHFEESLRSCNEAIEYQGSVDSVSLTENSIADNWDCENVDASTLKNEPESCNDEQDDGEETIATFVTAAGQQLALYAVEDSDEIFAVALYDESGEPPTNFQFLMKADVKRLIDEGAVRTLKKPAQMKKSVLTTESPVFYHKENFEELRHQANYEIGIREKSTVNGGKRIAQKGERKMGQHNYKIDESYSDSSKMNSSFDDIDYIADKQSDIAYLMMDNNSVNIAEQPDDSQDNYIEPEEEEELILCSTVQYIFLEDDQSESELTFDDIQETLQNLKHARGKASSKKDNERLSAGNLQSSRSVNSRRDTLREPMTIESLNDELDYYVSSQLKASKDKSEEDRQRLIDALTDSPPSMAIAAQPQLKVKRSRKQQLTSVNRDDSEIIIQPASMLSEEELTGKKRGRRRRGLPSQMRVAVSNAKRMKRKRREIVEVIDLDVDEEESQEKSNVVEITLEDSKDKYSSDKENEIIMIRDSDSDNGDDEEDDEEEDENEHTNGNLTKFNSVMRCEHCSRNFRQRRAFDTHLRVCEKSPENLLRLGEKQQQDKEESQQVKKQYACKICQEKFDVVVALARHVRAAHSQRKKQKLGLASSKIQDKSLRSVQQKEVTSTEEEEEESLKDGEKPTRQLRMLSRVKRKRRQKNNCSWEAKKLSCADCGRWFPSSALLNAHSLQHGTKKSEQLRKCHICKKLIRSRLLYLQHLKMHSDQRSSVGSSRLLRRKLRGRPSGRKIATPRKRGRPRKF